MEETINQAREELQIEIEECAHLKWDLDEIREAGDKYYNDLEFYVGEDQVGAFDIGDVPLSDSTPESGILCGLTGKTCALLGYGKLFQPNYMNDSGRCPSFQKKNVKYRLEGVEIEEKELFWARKIIKLNGEE